MKTKAEIVQELLDKDQITAEDAVVLLMHSKEKEFVYIPTAPAAPVWPWTPGTPVWYSNPVPAYSTTPAIDAAPTPATLYFTASPQ